jgi:hypothetical protein
MIQCSFSLDHIPLSALFGTIFQCTGYEHSLYSPDAKGVAIRNLFHTSIDDIMPFECCGRNFSSCLELPVEYHPGQGEMSIIRQLWIRNDQIVIGSHVLVEKALPIQPAEGRGWSMQRQKLQRRRLRLCRIVSLALEVCQNPKCTVD